MTSVSSRARPLAVEERQAMIIDAVIPLLLEHGTAVTSRQIAEAAGVAEGTIFRAFGDKESLVNAAVEAFMNGHSHAQHDHDIDPALPLEVKLAAIVEHMRHRVRNVMQMAQMTGRRPGTNDPEQLVKFSRMIYDLFEPNAAELRVTLEDLGGYLRTLSIASSIPTGGREFTNDDIVGFLMHGVVNTPQKKKD